MTATVWPIAKLETYAGKTRDHASSVSVAVADLIHCGLAGNGSTDAIPQSIGFGYFNGIDHVLDPWLQLRGLVSRPI